MTEKKIIISNNGVIITPYTKGDCAQLEKMTSVYDPVYYKYKELTGFILEYNGTPSFITHQNNPRYIQELFPSYQIEYLNEIKPIRMEHDFGLNEDITPTDIQYNILNQILNTSKNIKDSKEWFVNLQTGYGKTMLSIYLSSILKHKTLVTCFSSDILKQWISSIKKNTSFNMERLLLIDSSKILKSILDGKFNHSKYDMFFCTPRLLVSFAKRYGYENLYEVIRVIGIGFKVFDEAHRNMGNIVKINATTNVRHTLYLSADFGQSDREVEEKYYRIFYKVPIIRPDEEYQVTMKYTRAVIVEYDSKPLSSDIPSINDKYGFNTQYYMEYQMNNGMIFDVVKFILDSIFKNYDGHKILILLNHIAHVDRMEEFISTHYSNNNRIGRYHSMVTPEEKEFTLNDANIIISTYSSFGTGMDVDSIRYVLSLNQSGKIEDNQAAGRARPMKDGGDVFYFMVIDKGFRYTTRKLKTRLKYLAETKIKNISRVKFY